MENVDSGLKGISDKGTVQKVKKATEFSAGGWKTSADNKFYEINDLFYGLDYDQSCALEDKIYENYASAMQRHNREPLDYERFKAHFFEGGNVGKTLIFGSLQDGYLLGSEVNEIFIPTHFAPTGIRGGYWLFRNLLDSGKPTALFITEDLVDTIKKMLGWKILPFKMKIDFHGEPVEKTLVINKWKAISKLTNNELRKMVQPKIENLIYRVKKIFAKKISVITNWMRNFPRKIYWERLL